ncbi:MAG: sialate O-acetylesterase [Blastocatellia bacterium]
MKRSIMLLLVVLLTLTVNSLAEVRLSSIFANGMVLQRDRPVKIWGKANVGEAVTVRFRGEELKTVADALGRWEVFLKPGSAGGPFELNIQGNNSISLADVLVGEVWLASGQSNMEWRVSASNDAEKEIAAANYPQIRFYKVEHVVADAPQEDVKAAWQAVTPQTIGALSAVGYFFARHLHQQLKVPVAILQAPWGGTPVESWISPSALAADPALLPAYSYWGRILENHPAAMIRYEQAVAKWEADGKKGARPGIPAGPGHPHAPSTLWNGMIAPLVSYGIAGAIWYQGETNGSKERAPVYHRLFSAMITDWRRAWGRGDFPFLFVQLANYGKVAGVSGWPELREAQLQTLRLNNTAMAVTIDIGDSGDIHPKNKQDVGLRLALPARALAYGEKLVHSGPIFRQQTIETSALRLFFDHVGGGLVARGGELKGFEIAGADGKFVAATARIDGATVVVSSPEVALPTQARYGWADDPVTTLTNREGLPASPFRTVSR